MTKCEKCGDQILVEEAYEHAGNRLCEDCYLDLVATPKTCDPWAVYAAKSTMSQDATATLTPEQQRIFDLIQARGPLTLEQICAALAITEEEFRHDFATLRHMELARGCNIQGQVCYTLFDDQAV